MGTKCAAAISVSSSACDTTNAVRRYKGKTEVLAIYQNRNIPLFSRASSFGRFNCCTKTWRGRWPIASTSVAMSLFSHLSAPRKSPGRFAGSSTLLSACYSPQPRREPRGSKMWWLLRSKNKPDGVMHRNKLSVAPERPTQRDAAGAAVP